MRQCGDNLDRSATRAERPCVRGKRYFYEVRALSFYVEGLINILLCVLALCKRKPPENLRPILISRYVCVLVLKTVLQVKIY